MGGRALKGTFTRRYDRKEFEAISRELISKLSLDFKRVAIPLFYRKKETFGDCDIIVSMEDCKYNMRDYITTHFKPNEIFHNGNCWSFDYKEFQIDLITVAGEDFDSNYMYLSYNDLGNFIGRLAQGLGFKYGQEGLWLEHYFKGINVGSIMISKDYRKIFSFLGLSYERWEQGFDTLEDIFEYIAKSPFFNWRKFQLKELNKINRERNLKRASYMNFLEWMAENAADKYHEYKFADKEYYLTIADNTFPEANITREIRKLEYEVCKKLYINSKLDISRVKEELGLHGKELGLAIDGFKKSFGLNDRYETYMLDNDVEEIFKRFKLFTKIVK